MCVCEMVCMIIFIYMYVKVVCCHR